MKNFLIMTMLFCVVISPNTFGENQKPQVSEKVWQFLEVRRSEHHYHALVNETIHLQVEMNPLIARFAPVMRAFLDKYMEWETIQYDMAVWYDSAFTSSELQQLTAFYQSPIGRKLAQEEAFLAIEEMQIIHRANQKSRTHLEKILLGFSFTESLRNSSSLPVQAEQAAPIIEDLVVWHFMEASQKKASYTASRDETLRSTLEMIPRLKEHEAEIRHYFEAYMGWDAVKHELAALYSKIFTHDELKELIGFYQSPLGKKLTEKEINMLNEVTRLVLKRFEMYGAELEAEVEAEVEKMLADE